MKILIIKLSSIGDVIHTLPILPAIKEKLPEVEISWVVEKRAAEILRRNPFLNRLIEVDTKTLRHAGLLGKTLKTAKMQLRGLRASEFDLSIDFQGLFKSASLAKLTRTRKRYGFSKQNLREPASRVLLSKTVGVEPKQNIIYKNLELAEKSLRHFFGDENFHLDRKNIEFPIFTDEKDRLEAEEIISRAGGRFAILNPAGGWRTKLWPAENFGRLADLLWEELEIVPVISTAPSELKLAEKALAHSRSGKTISVQPGLKSFYELAGRAAVYVGGDTAPTHLAVAAGCPVVGIFGPTEWWRNGSINPEDICVERTDIDCRINCHRRTCDKWICLDIPAERVLAAVRKRLE